IPALLMAVMFYWGFRDYLNKIVAPADAMNVYVTASQWNWEFAYPDGGSTLEQELIGAMKSPVIAFPIDKPTKLIMTSKDVIHSFYIPAFRTKRDIFPNRYTTLWFQPTGRITHTFSADDKALVPVDPKRPGYYLFCAEYCGDQHSQMAARVAVLSQPDYEAWRKQQLNTDEIPLPELGRILYTAKGCSACHSVDGSRNTGPTWKGIWGSTADAAGWKSKGDEKDGVVGYEYVRESILDPGAYLVPGFTNQMSSYQGRVTEREILALTTYIKSLTEAYADEAVQDGVRELQERGVTQE
ncbi:MAG: c-type cytochrome, partial [Phycisphaerales bacterium]|nr:c-type cytochrome [Phycisphaerales bacterium]